MSTISAIHFYLMLSIFFISLTSTTQSTYAQSTSSPSTLTAEEKMRQKASAQKRVNRLSDQLKSPFCPGRTLMTCTSTEAYRLRQEMTAMILAGKTDEEILLALRDSFGDELETPPQPWYIILVPILPFIFGLLIAAWIFSKWMRGRSNEEEELVSTENLDESYKSRLTDLIHDD